MITGFFTPAFWDIEVECLPRSNYMNHAKSYHLNLYNKCKIPPVSLGSTNYDSKKHAMAKTRNTKTGPSLPAWKSLNFRIKVKESSTYTFACVRQCHFSAKPPCLNCTITTATTTTTTTATDNDSNNNNNNNNTSTTSSSSSSSSFGIDTSSGWLCIIIRQGCIEQW